MPRRRRTKLCTWLCCILSLILSFVSTTWEQVGISSKTVCTVLSVALSHLVAHLSQADMATSLRQAVSEADAPPNAHPSLHCRSWPTVHFREADSGTNGIDVFLSMTCMTAMALVMMMSRPSEGTSLRASSSLWLFHTALPEYHGSIARWINCDSILRTL